jgi:hypothetical protein
MSTSILPCVFNQFSLYGGIYKKPKKRYLVHPRGDYVAHVHAPVLYLDWYACHDRCYLTYVRVCEVQSLVGFIAIALWVAGAVHQHMRVLVNNMLPVAHLHEQSPSFVI